MKIEKLIPECKDYVWGGARLKERYGKQTEITPCAESWELSFHKDGLTRLSDGRILKDTVTRADIGRLGEKFSDFPMLIKFIDAKSDLSVQVHPSDEYALKNEGSYGKTEMWYVVEADEGAGIYLGFKEDVTLEEVKSAIKEKKLTELLNFLPVSAGDCYFIPSGTLHAIGAGCLICEIQQNSNLTYRVYDYGRRDKNGKERELHIDKALAVMDLSKFEPTRFDNGVLGECEYFSSSLYRVSGSLELSADGDSFNSVTAVVGSGEIEGIKFNTGDTFFVPAGYGRYMIQANATLIVTKI